MHKLIYFYDFLKIRTISLYVWINKLKQITYRPDEQSEIIKNDFESLRGLPLMIQWLWLVHGMHLCGRRLIG